MRVFVVLAAGLLLCAAALFATPATHDLASIVLLALPWMALAVALETLRSLGAGCHLTVRMLAAWPWGLVLAWHARELTRQPQTLGTVLLLSLGAAALLSLVPAAKLSRREAIGASAAASLATIAALAVAYHATELSRWHLLRHHTLLGTPAWWVFGEEVDAVRERLVTELEATDTAAVPPGLATPRQQREPGQPVNLVLILVDTLRADALADWGANPAAMPFLDGFVNGGARFRNVRSNSSWTRPAMASLMTGLAPEEHGARDVSDGLAEGHWTLAEALSTRGLETAAFVTNYGAAGREAGFAQGFESFFELRNTPYMRAQRVGERVLAWVDQRPAPERGLFLWVHLLDPHEPYLAGTTPEVPTQFAYRDAYQSELRELDQVLAEFLPALASRLDGPTAFLLLSDHGEEFFEHGLFGHGHTLYDEVLAVPAALVGEGIPAQALDQRLELRDFFSLALEWCSDQAFDVEAWARRSARATRWASVDYTGSGRLALRPFLRRTFARAVESPDGKSIWNAYGDTVERYDLGTDPGERRNVLESRREVEGELAIAPTLSGPWREAVDAAASDEAKAQLRALGYAD